MTKSSSGPGLSVIHDCVTVAVEVGVAATPVSKVTKENFLQVAGDLLSAALVAK